MKNNSRLWALIILLIIILMGFIGCRTPAEEAQEAFNKRMIQVTYKECEYLIYQDNRGHFSFTHKGNCKNHGKQ